ncbi:hypothetical protein ALP68_05008 [Pseudomonas ficuserectae]|nr:hypothetical protein ALP68_05008 [Pseudomonas ficuserectae]
MRRGRCAGCPWSGSTRSVCLRCVPAQRRHAVPVRSLLCSCRESVFSCRKADVFDRGHVGPDSRLDIGLTGHEVFYEFGYAPADGQAQHVVQHQYLAVGSAACANTDDRNFHRLGDFFGEFARHTLQQDHRCARLFQRDRVGTHLPCLCFQSTLNLVAAQYVDCLRRQAHVCAHRDAAFCQQTDRLGQPSSAFDLDHVRTCLHQRRAVDEGLLQRGVGHERQVGENHGALITAFHTRNVVRGFGGRDGQGAVVTLQDHAQRVAYQQHFDTGLAGGVGEGCVVAGQHGDFLTLLLHGQQRRNGYVRHVKSSIRCCEDGCSARESHPGKAGTPSCRGVLQRPVSRPFACGAAAGGLSS